MIFLVNVFDLFLLISKHMGKFVAIFHIFVVYFDYSAPTWIYSGYKIFSGAHWIFAFHHLYLDIQGLFPCPKICVYELVIKYLNNQSITFIIEYIVNPECFTIIYSQWAFFYIFTVSWHTCGHYICVYLLYQFCMMLT